MSLIIFPGALKQLGAMPKGDAARLMAALEQVAANLDVRYSFVTEMVGEQGTWRLRKGNWRAVYTIENEDVVVTNIGHRKDIYL